MRPTSSRAASIARNTTRRTAPDRGTMKPGHSRHRLCPFLFSQTCGDSFPGAAPDMYPAGRMMRLGLLAGLLLGLPLAAEAATTATLTLTPCRLEHPAR